MKIATILVLSVVIVSLLFCCVPSARAWAVQPSPGMIGRDVSWPNCEARPPRNAPFGIVGVTGGLVFRPNPCLFIEAHWFTNVSLYLNTGYKKTVAVKFSSFPRSCTHDNETCLAYNFGYNAGVYALSYAASQYVHAHTWWLDVETENSWSASPMYNRASLSGMIDAIRQNTLLSNIGFYAYPGQWKIITDGWKNHSPAWAATGNDSYAVAKRACALPSFTGGKIVLTQFILDLDHDYIC
jgi:hypothetical protein